MRHTLAWLAQVALAEPWAAAVSCIRALHCLSAALPGSGGERAAAASGQPTSAGRATATSPPAAAPASAARCLHASTLFSWPFAFQQLRCVAGRPPLQYDEDEEERRRAELTARLHKALAHLGTDEQQAGGIVAKLPSHNRAGMTGALSDETVQGMAERLAALLELAGSPAGEQRQRFVQRVAAAAAFLLYKSSTETLRARAAALFSEVGLSSQQAQQQLLLQQPTLLNWSSGSMRAAVERLQGVLQLSREQAVGMVVSQPALLGCSADTLAARVSLLAACFAEHWSREQLSEVLTRYPRVLLASCELLQHRWAVAQAYAAAHPASAADLQPRLASSGVLNLFTQPARNVQLLEHILAQPPLPDARLPQHATFASWFVAGRPLVWRVLLLTKSEHSEFVRLCYPAFAEAPARDTSAKTAAARRPAAPRRVQQRPQARRGSQPSRGCAVA